MPLTKFPGSVFPSMPKNLALYKSAPKALDFDYTWKLGDTIISCADNYNHLGIIISSKLTLSDRIITACRKGQKSYYALNDIGSNYLNPLTLSHLYKTIVLPTVIYGCELWSNLSTNDLERLNVFQHFVCKNAQNLPTKTRSDICEIVFNVLPIISEIDIRKLLFLGRLCLIDHQFLSKKIFSTRLFSFLENISNKQRGFLFRVSSIFCPLTVIMNTYKRDPLIPHFQQNRLGKR